MTNEEFEKALEDIQPTKEQKYVFKCKPTYQFQSIEFEVEGTKYDIDTILDLYKRVLDGLIQISPEQEKKVSKPVEALATDKQKGIMDRYGIKYGPNTTMSEAQQLIKKSLEDSF